jgi:hypothetical protein
MKALGLLIALAFSLIVWGSMWGCAQSTYYGHIKPPERFASGPVAVPLIVTSPAEVDKMCQQTGLPPGRIACAGPGVMIMPYPNPDRSEYEAILHHELGHVRGWGRDHEG